MFYQGTCSVSCILLDLSDTNQSNVLITYSVLFVRTRLNLKINADIGRLLG